MKQSSATPQPAPGHGPNWTQTGKTMDNNFSSIPVEVISRGRSLDEILTAYMDFHGKAGQIAAASGKTEDEIFADAMQGAVYRLYLLGVEDGMRAKNHT